MGVGLYYLDVGEGETRSFNAMLGWNDMPRDAGGD